MSRRLDRPAAAARATARLLVVNGLFTLAGAIVLGAGAYRLSAWLSLPPGAAFLWYRLGGAALALAALSFGASRLADRRALRLASRCSPSSRPRRWS